MSKENVFGKQMMYSSLVASIIYSHFEAKMMLLSFQIHKVFLPHKFGIFKYQMQDDFGSNMTKSLSRIIGEAEERRFGRS